MLEKYFRKKKFLKVPKLNSFELETLSKAEFSTFSVFPFSKSLLLCILSSKIVKLAKNSFLLFYFLKNTMYEKNAENPQNLNFTLLLAANSRSAIKNDLEIFIIFHESNVI